MSSWLELVIAVVIVLGIGIAIWNGGRANPQSTGRISRRVDKLEHTVSNQGEKLEQLDQAIERQHIAIERLIANTPTKSDIENLQKNTDKTWAAVDRMQSFFIEKGMTK